MSVNVSREYGVRHAPPRSRSRQLDLSRQIRRAASSVTLNIAEGAGRTGKDRLYHYRVARGSAQEVRSGLKLAVAWQHIHQGKIDASLDRLDTIIAMLCGLLRT